MEQNIIIKYNNKTTETKPNLKAPKAHFHHKDNYETQEINSKPKSQKISFCV